MDFYLIDRDILFKQTHDAVIKSIAKQYLKNNYKTFIEYKIANYTVDLYCENENSKIVFEVRNATLKQKKTVSYISKMQKYFEKNGYKFLLEYFEIPRKRKLEYEDIESILYTQLINVSVADELDVLSTHTRIEEILSTDLTEISIKKNQTLISGYADISVELQFGSDSDQDNDLGMKEYVTKTIRFSFERNNLLEITNFTYSVRL